MNDRGLDRLFGRYRNHGDLRALARVFDATAPALLGLALRLLGNAADAEDAVQATFLTAVRKPETYDGSRRLAPWLFGILTLHVREMRRLAARPIDPDRLPLRPPVDPVEAAADREFRAQVERAARGLPATYRAVVVPYLAEGKAGAELARELGISPGAVRVRLHRGLALLRGALPKGLALGLAAGSTTGRGLAAVRVRVLAEGALRAGAPLGAALAAGAGGMGTVTGSKLAWLAAGVTLLLLGAWSVRVVRGVEAPARGATATRVALADPHAGGTPSSPIDLEALPVATRLSADRPSVRFTGEIRSRENGLPLVGARVWILEDASDPTRRALAAESGADGRFSFDAPANAEERLRIEAQGHVPFRTPLSDSLRDERSQKRSRRASDDGREVDLGVFVLPRGAAVRGRVVREDGAGVPDAVLMLFTDMRPIQHPSPDTEHVVGRSGPDGGFELDPVADDALEYARLLFALGEGRLGWASFHTPDDLGPVEGLTVELAPTASLEVRVRTVDERPVKGAQVQCIPGFMPWAQGAPITRWWESPLPAPYEAVFVATTDAEGRATFPHLPVPARATEQVGPDPRPYGVRARAGDACIPEGACRLAAGDSAEIELIASPAVSVSLRGAVVDEAGTPIAGAHLRLRSLVRGPQSSWSAETESDAQGAFVLPPAEACVPRVELRAEAPGHAHCVQQLDLGAPGSEQPLRLVLPRAAPIAGRTVDVEGRPLPSVELALNQAGRNTRTRSRSDGSFTFDEAVPGSGSLEGFPPRIVEGGEAGAAYEWSCPVVDVQGGDRDVEVIYERFPARARLVLECVDARTGKRLTPDEVRVQRDPDPNQRMYVLPPIHREQGRVIAERLRPGSWTASVTTHGHATAYERFRIGEDDAEVRLVLHASEPATAEGRVDDGGHEWPADGVLLVTHEQQSVCTPAGTLLDARLALTPDGRFSAENLTPGRWKVRRGSLAYCDGHLPCSAELELELAPGENRGLVLELVPLARLRLVTREASTPKWVDVSIDDGSGEWRRAGRAVSHYGPSPRDFVVWLAPGEVRWRTEVREDGKGPLVAEPCEGRVTLRSGEETRVEYTARPTGE